MLISKENITSVIPQRAPFVMIDSLLNATNEGFESNFLVEEDNLFINDKILSESAIIEHIAQTCAAGFGYIAQQETPGEPKIGFIGAVTQIVPKSSAQLGNLLETKVNVLSSFDTIHLVEGVTSCNGQEILSCQMKIVLP